LWSTKKKIRFLEDRLKDLNEEKSDLQELIDELKGK
jgi:prefoldin subunit 5